MNANIFTYRRHGGGPTAKWFPCTCCRFIAGLVGVKIDVLNTERVREIYKAGYSEHKGAFHTHETATL